MLQISPTPPNIKLVNSFQALVEASFTKQTNAICWQRDLNGNFAEIVQQLNSTENITVIDEYTLLQLNLSEEGNKARIHILNDLKLLQEHGAEPVLNLLKAYPRDTTLPFFSTDVYSFHVDRAPLPVSTFLCTYYGAPSELVANAEAEQKILVPEIRAQLHEHFRGEEKDFDSYLSEHFFDLHYRALPKAQIINCGTANLWRLAVDCADSPVPPCIHRAPNESGEPRLLLIC